MSVDAAWTRSFGGFVERARQAGDLVVQPRMGMSSPHRMRAGLLATRRATATTVGTITLDSYTRMGDDASARAALASGSDLNGYPIVAYDVATTRAVLDDVAGVDFPVQVRHGSPCPEAIFEALINAGMHATEGGPVSYCLPYSRTPLETSIQNWARACEILARLRGTGVEPHLETFGGCMLGQLCPPGLLIAMSVLECLFFRQHGLRSVSLSYAQQTSPDQDAEAVLALRRLAAERLPDLDAHVVVYTYMGVYPRTPEGARRLLNQAVRLAVQTGAARLIVKTAAEAHRIPTIAENVAALETAAATAAAERRAPPAGEIPDTGIYAEAKALVDAVVDLEHDLGRALATAFRRGYLDIPYCLHPDNAGRARSYLDGTGRLQWSHTGSMPIRDLVRPTRSVDLTAAGLLASLSYVERKFDDTIIEERPTVPVAAPDGAPRTVKGAKEMAQIHGTRTAGRPLPTSPREHLSSPVTRSVLAIQHRILTAARGFLCERGFTELLAPIIGPVTDPGARGSKQVDVDYYGHRYKLMTSAILYKQASLVAFDKIFFIAPNVRLEPLETASTNRHLAEFHQIDVEVAGGSREDVMRVAEEMFGHVVQQVVGQLGSELESLGRDTSVFAGLLSQSFDRQTHADAVTDLHGMGHAQDPNAEIDWAGEAMLSRKASKPFFITDYPKGSRGFYDRENLERPGFLRNFDLIAPEGYGELCSGSEREHDYATIISRIRETGENPGKYGWYLQMLREGLPSSAGFGMGLERLTRYLAGLDSVWEASAYPKIPGVVAP